MTGRGRGKKRKSEDFIFEVDKIDLSSDEDDSVTAPECKITKFDGELKESSNTQANDPPADENEDSNKSVVLDTEESNDMETTQSCTDKNSPKSNDVEAVDSKENTEESNKSDVIICNDSSSDLNQSCILIETPIPVVVLDCTDAEEEGEIIEDLEVVDEVAATPFPKPSVSITTEQDKTMEELRIGDEKFRVVEEIGPSPNPGEKKNLMNISFRCEKTMNQYGHLLVKFLKSFPELEVSKNKLSIVVNETETFLETSTPKKRNKKKKVKKELFVVDPNPSSNEDNKQHFQFKYTSKFELKEEGEEEKVKTAPSSKICFNCDGDHALRDCGIPRNFRRINQARQQFQDKYKTVRYHVNQNQKLADLKPGVISDDLRNALGLRKNDLPEHIYRMRCLGYPPGWLEEAKVQPSSLNLFNIDGKKVENRKTNKSCIDPSKIVDYPGFNVPPKKGIHDDFRKHNVKPYNKWMHKSAMIKHFEENYQKDDLEETKSDMDISQTQEIEKTVEKSVKDEEPADSLSLVDLEVQKKELVDQLNSSKEQAKTSSVESDEGSSQEKTENDENNESVVVVKNTELGTPILKSDSPYSRLPNPDNFSVGVSPVIDFENLPNSTGKYEELSKVLSKVRMTMKNIL